MEIDQVEPDGTVTVGRFMEWAVGKEGELMRPDTGRLMMPDSQDRLGRALRQHQRGRHRRGGDGRVLLPEGQEPKYRQRLVSVGSSAPISTFRPTPIVAHEGFFVLPKAARIESFQPHMHLRGKAQALEAILPTGQTVMLSHVDNFNFNWHNAYIYADEVAPLLPKGTVLKVISWHDNTAANKANPDPNVWVGYGERTVDEMNHIWMNVTYLDEADYLAEVDARRGKPPNSNSSRRARVGGRKMGMRRTVRCLLMTVLPTGSLVSAQERRFPMPLEPIGNANEAVYPAYEGWGESQDGGSYYIVLGLQESQPHAD